MKHRFVVAAFLLSGVASAAPFEPPCKGCLLDVPKDASADHPSPMLVVLHGDEGAPSMIESRFRGPAIDRGFVLLTPKCPRDLGCDTGSYWRWDGDPAWLSGLVDDVASKTPIDRARVFVAGWSGGASYLGRVAPKLQGFSAIAILGGGLAPAEAGCAPCAPPVYMMEGDKNPLHSLALESREAFRACHAELEWDFLPGRDHGGELAALNRAKIDALLSWMDAHRADCSAKPVASSPVSHDETATAPTASSRGETTTPSLRAAPLPSPPTVAKSAAGCGCSTVAPGRETSMLTTMLAACSALLRSRKSSKQSPRKR